MKNYILILLSFISVLSIGQQGVYIQGATITMPFGDSLYVNGSIVNDVDVNVNNVNSKILNTGAIYVTGDITNNSNENLFWNDSSGVVILNGTTSQNLVGAGLNFYALQANNSAGVVLQDTVVIQDTLTLVSGGIDLNGHNLYMPDSISTSYLIGENNVNYIFGASGEIVVKERFVSAGGNIAGLGLELPGNTLGQSELRRGHFPISTAGDGSIGRYYSVVPSNPVTASVSLSYLDHEPGGQNESDFQVFHSVDSAVWRQQNGLPSAALNQVANADVIFAQDTVNFLTITESTCDNPPAINFADDTLYRCGPVSVLIDPQLTNIYEFRWSNLESDSAIMVNAAGNYIVEVIDSAGCFSIDSVRLIDAALPVAAVAITPVLLTCMGTPTQFDGSASTGGIVNYIWDYLGDNSITDTTQISSSSHVYSAGGDFYARLTVETNEGCLDSAIVTVQVDSLPSISFGYTDVCADSTALFTNGSFGQGAFNTVTTVLWDFGNGNTSASFTPPSQVYSPNGNYSVKLIVTEDGGCKDSLSQTITVHPNPLASFTQTTICDGDATVFTNVSTNSASYSWSFGDGNVSTTPNPTHTYANDGNYTATLLATSTFGCTNEISNSVIVNRKPIASFSFIDVCQYDTVAFYNTTIDTINPVFTWSFGDATTSSLIAPTKHYVASGNYPVQLKVSSSNGCADSVTQNVSIFELPVSQFTIGDNCMDSIISLTNTSSIGSGSIANYLWDFKDGQTDVNQFPSINYNADGAYAPTLVVISNNGCSDSTSQNIIIHPNPVFTFLDTITSCGTSITLDAENVGSSYLWTTTEINQTINASTDGAYGVEVTTPFGCHDEDSTYILLNVLVNPNIGNDTIVCDSLIIDAYSPSSSYLWSTTEVDSAIVVFSSGTYYVDRIDQNLCSGSDTIIVTVNTSPVANLGVDQVICDDDNVVFNAGNPSLDFLWNTAEITQLITADTSGIYSVLVTDIATGCFDQDSVLLTVNSLPTVSLGNDTTVCDSLVLYPGAYSSVVWSNTSINDSIVPITSSTYWVDVFNTFGCTASDTINLTVFSSPILDLGPDTILCQNETLNLIGASIGSHTWSDASVLSSYLVSAPGVIYLDVIDGICAATDTITVGYDSIWAIDLGLDTGTCVGLDVDLIPNYTSGLALDWYQGTNFLQTGSALTVSQSGTYIVQATNSYGCMSLDTIQFTSYPYPVASDFLMASDAAPGDTVQFIPVTIDSNLTYLWSFGNGATSTDTLAAYRYLLMGDYDVELTVSNGFCSDSLIKTISISPSKNVFGFDPSAYINTQSTILDAVVYPNPSNGSFNVAILLSEEEWVDARFMDLQGKIICYEKLGKEIEQNYTFDFNSKLQSGVYLLQLKSGIESKILKIVISK